MTDLDRLYELPRNTVVAAGAGTGKTHRLTGLYVHLVAGLTELGPDVSPDRIVATTFTREAGAEMRARIERRLRLLADRSVDELVRSGGDDEAWASEIARTCERRGVRAPSRAVFRNALDALPRATITTFHAWAGEILRAFPIEAKIAPGFALLEPEESDSLIARAVDEVAARWADDPDEAKQRAVRTFLSSGIGPLEECVAAALLRANEEGVDVRALPIADDDASVQAARARRTQFFEVLDQVAMLRAVDKKRGQDSITAIAEARAHLRALVSGIDFESHADGFAEAVKQIHALVTPAKYADLKQMIDERLPSGKSVTEKARFVADGPERTAKAGALSLLARELLAEVDGRVVAEKRRLRALDFGDVLRKARDLLLDHPEVQAEVASEVRALLVDEFQDTNALQRDLVYLVRQEKDAIAKRPPGVVPDPSTLAPTGLFLVGDRKQSIYGFRGADVAVFQRMAVDLTGDAARVLGVEAEVRGGTGAFVPLHENRRSVDEILRFVNEVASVDMRGSDALSAVERVRFHPETEALRSVRSSGRSMEAPNVRVVVPTIELPERAASKHSDLSTDLVAALAIAGEIRALLDDPSIRELSGPLRPRDVAILIRSYKILPPLELALSLQNVDYAVAAGRGLYSTVEASDLDALVRLALDRDDRHAMLAVLRGPFVSLSDRTLLGLCGDRGLELPTLPELETHEALADEGERTRLRRLSLALQDLSTFRGRLGAGAALHRVLDALGIERTLALLPGGEARIRDLRKLVEVADRFPQGLAHFARHLARAKEGEVDEGRGAVFDREDDVVRVMTIHAAKGLEFRVVAVMQLEQSAKKSDSMPMVVRRAEKGLALAARLEKRGVGYVFGEGGRALRERAVDAERAERQRLTYVALTRARDCLYAVAAPRKSKHQYDTHSAARSIADVLEERPELAVRPELRPTLRARASESRLESHVPARAFGEGPIVAHTEGSLVVATSLADFDACPRRFRLLHLAGLAERSPRVAAIAEPPDESPVPSPIDASTLYPDEADEAVSLPVAPPPGDPRAQGILAHLALERAPMREVAGERAASYAERFLRGEGYDPTEGVGAKVAARIVRFLSGDYARSLVAEDVEVLREHPFLVRLPSGVSLRGTIDLLVTRRGGERVEVVDYKSGEGGPREVSRYALQLRAYAAAVATTAPAGAEIVAGVVFLGRGDGRPIWLDGGEDLGTGAIDRIDQVARGLLAARASGSFPPVERRRCEAIRCGFLPLCHPSTTPGSPAREER